MKGSWECIMESEIAKWSSVDLSRKVGKEFCMKEIEKSSRRSEIFEKRDEFGVKFQSPPITKDEFWRRTSLKASFGTGSLGGL